MSSGDIRHQQAAAIIAAAVQRAQQHAEDSLSPENVKKNLVRSETPSAVKYLRRKELEQFRQQFTATADLIADPTLYESVLIEDTSISRSEVELPFYFEPQNGNATPMPSIHRTVAPMSLHPVPNTFHQHHVVSVDASMIFSSSPTLVLDVDSTNEESLTCYEDLSEQFIVETHYAASRLSNVDLKSPNDLPQNEDHVRPVRQAHSETTKSHRQKRRAGHPVMRVSLEEVALDGSGHLIQEHTHPVFDDSEMISNLHDFIPKKSGDEEDDDGLCDNDIVSRQEELDYCGKRVTRAFLKLQDRMARLILVGALKADQLPPMFRSASKEVLEAHGATADEVDATIRSMSYQFRIGAKVDRAMQAVRSWENYLNGFEVEE